MMRRTTCAVVATILLTGCGADPEETVADAAERLLETTEVRQPSSIDGPVDVIDTVRDGDCAVAYFVETRGPYDLSLVMRNTDGWEMTDVVTGHNAEPNADFDNCWRA